MTRAQALILAARLARYGSVQTARRLVRTFVPCDGRVMAAIETHRTPPLGEPTTIPHATTRSDKET